MLPSRESPQLSYAISQAASTLRFCADCGLAICAERLAAVPLAQRCLDCQGRIESEEMHSRPFDVEMAPVNGHSKSS